MRARKQGAFQGYNNRPATFSLTRVVRRPLQSRSSKGEREKKVMSLYAVDGRPICEKIVHRFTICDRIGMQHTLLQTAASGPRGDHRPPYQSHTVTLPRALKNASISTLSEVPPLKTEEIQPRCVYLTEHVTRRQCHQLQVGRVPGGQYQPSIFRLCLDPVDEICQLVHPLSGVVRMHVRVFGTKMAPLKTINRAQVVLFPVLKADTAGSGLGIQMSVLKSRSKHYPDLSRDGYF
jgi:hypothetical protein